MRGVQLGFDGNGCEVWMEEGVRTTHMHVIGASSSGKTKFLEHLIRQDIRNGQGLCLIDPTGNLYYDLVRWCETNGYGQRRKIALFEPAHPEVSFGFNPLACGPTQDEWAINFLVGSLVATFAQVWGGENPDATPLLQRLLRSVLHVLAEHNLTLVEADWLTSAQDSTGVRQYLTERLQDHGYRREWEDLNGMRPREFEDRFMSVQNRLTKFIRSPAVRSIVGSRQRVFESRGFMDERGILLCNLSSDGYRLPPDDARLLGMLLVNDLVQKARGRPKGSPPFYLYIDECYSYLNEDIATILDQMRQFGLHLILAHQHLGQLDRAGSLIKGAIMTDARTKVVFGGLTMESATVMANDLFAGELNLEEPKHVLDKPVVVGHQIIWLESQSHSESRSVSSGESEGISHAQNLSVSNTHQWSEGSQWSVAASGNMLAAEANHSWGGSTSRGGISSASRGTSSGWNRSQQRSESVSSSTTRGVSQALAPVYATLPSAVYSLQEQQYRNAAYLRNLPQKTAIVKPPFARSVHITVPVVVEGYARDERVGRFRDRVLERSDIVAPRAAVEAEIAARAQTLERLAQHGEDTKTEPDDFCE